MFITYTKPGRKLFDRTLPLGNGMIGATVYPDPERERILLNHAWLWRRIKTSGMKNPEVSHWLPYIRSLFFAGRTAEAGDLANKVLGTQARSRIPFYAGNSPVIGVYGPDPFVPGGELILQFDKKDRGTHFQSQLQLETGEAFVEIGSGKTQIRQRSTVSRDHDLYLMEITCEDGISGSLRFERIEDSDCQVQDTTSDQQENTLGMFCTLIEGRTFAMQAFLKTESGSSKIENGSFFFQNIRKLQCMAAIATDHEGDDPQKICADLLETGKDLGFDPLWQNAVFTQKELFTRVSIEVEAPDRSFLPTDERMNRFALGEEDPEFQILMLQLHRYFALAYSKKGGMPGNLRGIWSDETNPEWCCDIHNDIDSQGNYFSVDALAIPETTDVLFEYLESLLPAAREAAQKIYGCRGIFIPLTTSCWPECFKLEPGWDEMVSVAGWFAQSFWWRYDFYRDVQFLRDRAYPYIREAALFYMDYMVPDPRQDSPTYGMLQIVPSYSPENNYIGGNKQVSLTINCSFELQIVRQLFEIALKSAEILQEPESVQSEYRAVLGRLPALPIDAEGKIQEWYEDYPQSTDTTPWDEMPGHGHRHLSPVVGVFPGELITPRKTPELADAAYKFMLDRIRYGGCRSGWSAWGGAVFARLGYPEKTQERIRGYFKDHPFYDDPAGPFSSAFSPMGGLFACIASAELEMILQSHEGDILLLPALPDSWASGTAKGLRARGGFIVSLTWKDHAPQDICITSEQGGPCTVSYKDKTISWETEKGKLYHLSSDFIVSEQ